MLPEELETKILRFVAEPHYKPVKPRTLLKKMKLDDDYAHDLKRAVKRLVKRGELAYGPSHLVASAKSAKPPSLQGGGGDKVTGVFRRAAAGFGFVRISGTAPGADRSTDIYIDARDAGDASTGDIVLVKLKKKRQSHRANPEGEIAEVVERDKNRFVGTYFEKAGSAYVQVDGKPFTQPILVGDPGAKNAAPDDKVVIEMVRFPSQTHDGEGVIVEVLGGRGESGVDTLSIIREFDLPEDFAEDALEEARQQALAFDESIGADRRDLTDLVVITIDPIDARDFDDAISLVKNERGHWVLGVHIADVVHFVRPKTALDREAHDRATSVYLPDRVLPMLPEVISNGLASLQPDRVRYTKSVFIEMTEEGVVTSTEAMSGAIRSRRRFAYEEYDQYLTDQEPWRTKLTPEVFRLLSDMHTLAMRLRGRRTRRGSLELTMPEVKIDLDRGGAVSGAHLVVNSESHQVIEEFMLQANEAVAQILAGAGLHFLRRVHSPPELRKLKALTEFVSGLGFEVESLESRFELQRLLAMVQGKPEQPAVNFALLKSLQRAVYSPEEEGHFALASECYCHFTSPIRRYPDLTVHRLLEAHLAHKKPRNDFAELVVLGEHCSNRERRAEAAERELVKVKLLTYLSARIGLKLEAVVTGVEEFGLFVMGKDLPAEGLVHVSSLDDDFYRYDRQSHTLSGNRSGNAYRLGDKVTVTVARVDVDRRELDFRVVGRSRAEGDRGRPQLTPQARLAKMKQDRLSGKPKQKPRQGPRGKGRR